MDDDRQVSWWKVSVFTQRNYIPYSLQLGV